MASRIFLTVSIFAACVGLCFGDTEAWESFKRQYGRQYGPEEEAFRRRVFADNLALIRRHNAEFAAGRSAYRLGVNQFADLTGAEFGRLLRAGRPAAPLAASSRLSGTPPPDPPPAEFDWRKHGAPIRIKDQGQMGSAWAMAVASAVECGLFISDSPVVALSAQNLVDCVPAPGSPLAGLEYARDSGLASAADYPDVGPAQPCHEPVTPAAWVSEVHAVPQGDEATLQQGLLMNPVPVLIDASHFSFQLYAGGIYSEPNCSDTRVDHSVLLVGYGNKSGTGFWTLANSWGTGWGEGGFMRMERGTNMCGVASYAAYPTGVHPGVGLLA